MAHVQQIFKITPLTYIKAGQDALLLGEWEPVVDGDTAREAFLSYAKFMEDHYHTITWEGKNGKGSKMVSYPLQVESFLLYCDMTMEEWAELKKDPLNLGTCSFIEMAIEAQQNEGGFIGEYQAKMVQMVQGKKEKVELSGSLAIEQITGMEVK